MSALTARSARRRFLVLTALRWLPVGVIMPVVVLLPLDRGLSLSQLGLAAAMQGVVVLALELPTGGLADSIGRRPVLILATGFGISSMVLFLLAQSFAAFLVVFALQGIYRALDSGPLEAWYVDAALAADPRARIEDGLSGSGVVLGLAVAGGALASGGLVALDPFPGGEALAGPIMAGLVLQLAELVAIAALMTEARDTSGLRAAGLAALDTTRAIADGVRLLRGSRILLAIVAVELFWGFGMTSFESLTPVRLAEIVGDTDRAAAITGPAMSGAWVASAAGAALVPWVGRRFGMAPTAAGLRILQGVAVVGIAWFGGLVGVISAFLVCYAIHGAANPAHMTLLHRQVEGPRRATVVSMNSMVAQPAGALGIITLTAIADGTSVSVAMSVGAAVLAIAAPLYVPAWRQERRTRRESSANAPC